MSETSALLLARSVVSTILGELQSSVKAVGGKEAPLGEEPTRGSTDIPSFSLALHACS